MEKKDINDILGIDNSESQNKNTPETKSSATNANVILSSGNNEGLISFLYGFGIILVLGGIIVPIYLISKIPSIVLERSPEVLIFPIYLGLIMLIFSALCYSKSVVLKKPSIDTKWIENALNSLSAIIIIIGFILFFIAISETSGSLRELRNLGFGGGVVLLIFHVTIGLLCAGMAAIHKKYGLHAVSQKTTTTAIFCSSCGTKVADNHGQFCEECGNKL